MLDKLQQQLAELDSLQELPLAQWQPAYCGELPLYIDTEGRWHYQGSLIERASLVRLFSRVLWREAGRYYLKTPVEKIAIKVADVPFVFVTAQWQDNVLVLTTQTGDKRPLVRPEDWQLRPFRGQQLPYVRVRRNLWGRLGRNPYYQLADGLTERCNQYGFYSAGQWFAVSL